MPPSSASSAPIGSANSCSNCSDGWILVVGEGLRRCDCLKAKIRGRAMNRIPTIYRGLTLETVKPDFDRHPSQERVIAALRQSPESSFAFFGVNGCGKSLFGWLLYRQAVDSNRNAVGLPLAELLSQFRAWEKDSDQLPDVTPGDLRQGNRRYLLWFDEVEKARPSEFSAEMFFRVVDAAYSFDHQLVIASNLKPEELSRHWATNGETYGPSTVRRIMEMRDGLEVPMF